MPILDLLLAASLASQVVPVQAGAAAAAGHGQLAGVVAAQPADSPIPAPDQVMAIPEALRAAFRERVVDSTNIPELKLTRMVDFMLGEDGLHLQYKADATRTVAESYATRQVNCLSFTLMAVALAREAGMKAQGQEIDRVLAWSLVGDVVMQSTHANAVVRLKDRNLQVKDGRDFVLDIAGDGLYNQQRFIVHGYAVDDDRLLASFYGNRAMELLAQGRLAESKAWLDQAMALDPANPTIWNNAGVLARQTGDMAGAERWFLRAVRRDPRMMSVLNNLVAMYQAKGDEVRSEYWRGRADRVLRRDPFYQFSLGELNARAGNYDDAARYYRRAISLDGRERLFHFGLARAYVKLGKLDRAGKELDAAYRLSAGADRARFQAKLDALRSMATR